MTIEQMSPVDAATLPTRYVVAGLYRGRLLRLVKDRLYDGPDKTTAAAVFDAAKPIDRYKTLNIGQGIWTGQAYRWETLESTRQTQTGLIVEWLVYGLVALTIIAALTTTAIGIHGSYLPDPASGRAYKVRISSRSGSMDEYVTELESAIYMPANWAKLTFLVSALLIGVPGEISFRRARKRIVALGGQAPATGR